MKKLDLTDFKKTYIFKKKFEGDRAMIQKKAVEFCFDKINELI